MNPALRLVAVVATALVAASSASAHVHVTAPATKAGERAEFTVGVPNERPDAATVRVSLRVPAAFQQVEPVSTEGWKIAQSQDGDATVLTWSGGRITGTDHVEHSFHAVTPAAGSYPIPATQTYDDGQVVRWIEAPGTEFPAPVVTIGGAASDPDPTHTIVGAPTPEGETASETETAASENAGDDSDAPVLAIVGGAVAVVLIGALAGVLIRRRRRGGQSDG